MSEQGESESGNSEQPEEKSGWVGKLVSFGIAAALGLGIAYMKGGQKDKWFEEQHQLSVGWCHGDGKCSEVVEKHWKHCLDDHHESARRGKYSRKYTLDEPGYRDCLVLSGADLLAKK